MTEGFKNANRDREMRMQLFLLSRIIMLRLTSTQLAEALRKLWPHLLAELVSVFDVEPGQTRDYWLTIEGIKIVELMSQLNIEDFQMNQWMFLFDGYGMDFVPAKERDLDMALQQRSSSEADGRFSDVFQPYLVKFMCRSSAFPNAGAADGGEEELDYGRWQFNFYKVAAVELEEETNFRETTPLETRAAAYTLEEKRHEREFTAEATGDDANRAVEREVHKYAYTLQDLLAASNVKMMRIDRQGADALIEKDFLKKPKH